MTADDPTHGVDDEDEVTLAASSDLVGQIRAAGSGASADDIAIWTPEGDSSASELAEDVPIWTPDTHDDLRHDPTIPASDVSLPRPDTDEEPEELKIAASADVAASAEASDALTGDATAVVSADELAALTSADASASVEAPGADGVESVDLPASAEAPDALTGDATAVMSPEALSALRNDGAEAPTSNGAEPAASATASEPVEHSIAAPAIANTDREPFATTPTGSAKTMPPVDDGVSLIAGASAPSTSATFWDRNEVGGQIATPGKSHARSRRRLPFWLGVAALVILIVAASVAIALVIASSGGAAS